MVKQLPKDQQDRIRELIAEGKKTHKEIAADVGLGQWGFKTVARYAKQMRDEAAKAKESSVADRTLDEMGRDERFVHLQRIFETTPRARFVFKALKKEEKEVFVDEYLRIIKSTDSITEAEEQQLFSSCIEYVLALRALSFKTEEEEMYAETMDGQWEKGDERYRPAVDDSFAKAYNQHISNYQKFMHQLKLSREQRLNKIRNDKRTLTDLAAELMSKSAQSSAAEEIERLSKERDEELLRLVSESHVFGVFED